MAAAFVFAVASDREIDMMGKGREKRKALAGLRERHFGPVSLNEGSPLGRCAGLLPELYGFGAWRENWKPDVIPIL